MSELILNIKNLKYTSKHGSWSGTVQKNQSDVIQREFWTLSQMKESSMSAHCFPLNKKE